MLEKNSHASIIEKVRNQNNVITSKNCPELAKRIKELSKEFMVKMLNYIRGWKQDDDILSNSDLFKCANRC